MKKDITLIVAVLLLLMLLTAPMTTFAGNGVTPTTTLPSYTTTSTRVCDCCSSVPPVTEETTTTNTTERGVGPSGGWPPYTDTTTTMTTTTTCPLCGSATTTLPPTTTTSDLLCVTNTTFPPTTTTTLNLTGPDGTAPPVTTPTTGPDESLCGECVDLLSTASIVTSEKVAMLGNPAGGYWLSCDCYSNNGETITISPTNSNGWDLTNLHITIRSNVAFTVKINDIDESTEWLAQAIGGDSAILAAGAYVVSIDLTRYDVTSINEVEITMHAAGSISVGHLALSDEDVCMQPPPNIQTTTIPKFPWDTTTTTGPTTNPTVGDVFYPGDVDDDGVISTRDARMILMYTVGNITLNDRQLFNADFNFDGKVNTADARDVLFVLTN